MIAVPDVERVDDGLHLSLANQEAGILRELVKEMRLLLQADIPESDPVMQRLFPRAHEDDEEERTYQDLVGNELHRAKLDALRSVAETLGAEGDVDVLLPAPAVDDWLRLLNDVRLAIGTRLDVDQDKMDRTHDPSDPEAPALSVLHWLGWLQGSILEEMA